MEEGILSVPSPPKSVKCTLSDASVGLELRLIHSVQKGELQLSFRREPEKPEKNLLKNLYQSGLSLPRLGKLFGVHRSTVSRWMRGYGIERRSFNKLWTEKEISALKEFYPKLEKIEMILPSLSGRTLESIYKKAQILGLKWAPKKRPNRQELEKLYKTLGTMRAAESLGISPTTFRRWMRDAGAKLESPIKNPNLAPSAKLIYVLGVLKGDGYVYKRGRANVVELGTSQEKFVKSFATALREIGLSPSLRVRRLVKGAREYHVYITSAISKNFVGWYKKLSLAQIKEMVGENKEFVIAFIRGFYESEGSYEISKGYPSISIFNTDLPLLLFVKKLISSLGYDLNLNKAGKTCTGKLFYRIRKCGGSIPQLINTIKPCIKAEPRNAGLASIGKGDA